MSNIIQQKNSDDADAQLAQRLAGIVENANARVKPICGQIRQHIETATAQQEVDESALVNSVRPLIAQAEKTLHETDGAIRACDPDGRLAGNVRRGVEEHTAGPEEQRLAQALKVLMEDVHGTIEWAKDRLNSFPKAKKDLGPLLDALTQPLTQIVGGVGLLLAGVLNLLGNLLHGLGLDGLLKGIVAATGLDKIYKGLGLEKWLGKNIV